jgi:uncharacterized protein YecT (DUF1311 family)
MRNKIAIRYLTLFLASFSVPCLALDNPDAPDYVADFQQRAQVFEAAIHRQAKTTQDYLRAYAEYEQFLDKELNTAYQSLLAKLGTEQQVKLKQAQRNWIKYRNSEVDFIAENWTTKNFGSSAVLSRGAYRTMLIRDRTTLLLNYLKNYWKTE